jgi:long-chain acyl-CoA synthetase
MELRLANNIIVDQVCVVGIGLSQPIALVTLSATGKSRPQPDVEAELSKTVYEMNKGLEKHERIQAVVVMPESWTIESGLLTPSMKIKRDAVEKKYHEHYKDWISRDDVVVWAQ